VENRFDQQLRTFRTNNGGKFTSTQLQEYLKKCGVLHEVQMLKTLEHNESAERLNRTLVEATRSMLLDAKFPQSCWAEEISTAAY